MSSYEYITDIANAATTGLLWRANGDANGDGTGDPNDTMGINGTWISTPAYGTPPAGKGLGKTFEISNGNAVQLPGASVPGGDMLLSFYGSKTSATDYGEPIFARPFEQAWNGANGFVVAWSTNVNSNQILVTGASSGQTTFTCASAVNSIHHYAISFVAGVPTNLWQDGVLASKSGGSLAVVGYTDEVTFGKRGVSPSNYTGQLYDVRLYQTDDANHVNYVTWLLAGPTVSPPISERPPTYQLTKLGPISSLTGDKIWLYANLSSIMSLDTIINSVVATVFTGSVTIANSVQILASAHTDAAGQVTKAGKGVKFLVQPTTPWEGEAEIIIQAYTSDNDVQSFIQRVDVVYRR